MAHEAVQAPWRNTHHTLGEHTASFDEHHNNEDQTLRDDHNTIINTSTFVLRKMSSLMDTTPLTYYPV